MLDGDKDIELHFTYWTDSLSDSYAVDVVEATLRALDAIVQDPGRPLPVVGLLSDDSRERILHWNSSPQVPLESTVHALIEAHVKEVPDACAVTSWEGELSYAELDRLSTRLACHLRSLGVGPEVTVPLCFRKSLWTVVAMVAVMKAGGVFVPLDPSHPPERISMIVEQLPARLVALTSPDVTHIVSHLVDTTFVVTADSLEQLPGQDSSLVPSPAATPDNGVYIIFTSGSTGLPKGVVLDHRAAATGTTLHGRAMSFGRDTRTLQFSSYSFDACIMEIITTLVHGGCVCVLSEDERINELAAAANRLRVNWAFLTPAVASTIDPSEISTLGLIAIGGELLAHSVIKKWACGTCRVVQVYGPTECCAICTYDDRTGLPVRPEVIGKPMGCNTWIVDPRDPNVLMPVGAVGELLVHGPIEARGYLNDADKTRSAFLTGLAWLPDGIKNDRLYRTGDLVRYNTDNTLSFVRRKDTQVKVRGQRIELGEISYQIGASHEAIATRLVVLGSAGKFAGKIVAVLAFRDLGSDQQDGPLQVLEKQEDQIQAQARLVEIQNFIADKLPSYMHPAAMIAVNALHTTVAGKTDARRVAAWVDNMDDQTYSRIMSLAETDEVPTPVGEIERIIHAAIGEVVNLSLQQVDMRRSFISLGGDSITAMQVMALCRLKGISLPVQDILKSANITAMAAKAKRLGPGASAGVEKDSEEHEHAPFSLSPIQKLHFAQFPEGENHYNQSMLLKLQRPVSAVVIYKALRELVRRHPMLRARFEKNSRDGQWMQKVNLDADESFSFASNTLASWDEAQALLSEAEESLDITDGPLLAARFVHVPEFSALFMVAHHVVIDLVSWRILLRELEQLVDGISLPKAPSSWSYQRWVRSLESYSEAHASSALALAFTVPEANLGYWGMDTATNDFTNLVHGQFTLSPELTDVLLRAAGKTLKAEVLDVMLAMAAHTFGIVFPDRAMPAIHTETHGRDHPSGADVAALVQETVGWFTAIAPLVITTHGEDYVDSLILAKDIRRAIPGSGVPYFTAKMFQQSQKTPLEILFNYLGRFQQLERADGLFKALPKSMSPVDVNLSAARLSLIDLSAVIERDALTVSWSYDGKMKHQDRLVKWLALYEQALTEASSALHKATVQLTRSDVPLLPVSHEKLGLLNETLVAMTPNGIAGIEDVYPTSPMQRGILLSQSKDASQYDVHAVWEIYPSEARGQPIDVSRLQQAWDRVVQRHPMLRTIFVSGLREDSPFDQVVLKEFHPLITYFTYNDDKDEDNAIALHRLWEAARGGFDANAPPHRLAICSSPGGKVFAHFQVSHALIDATSLQILLRDWSRAYASDLGAWVGPSYSSYIAHIQQTTLETSLRFWMGQLEGTGASRLPRLTDGVVPADPRRLKRLDVDIPFATRLRALAKRLNISVANIFQLAWALVLRSYTNSQDVCFGYITSGRDVELDGVQDVLGPFINMLISRVVFDEGKTATSMLQKLFGTYLDSLPHQHASLADIKHALQQVGEQLFNTVLSFQKVSASGGAGQAQESPISFRSIRGADPTEVSSYSIMALVKKVGLTQACTSMISQSMSSNPTPPLTCRLSTGPRLCPNPRPTASLCACFNPSRPSKPPQTKPLAVSTSCLRNMSPRSRAGVTACPALLTDVFTTCSATCAALIPRHPPYVRGTRTSPTRSSTTLLHAWLASSSSKGSSLIPLSPCASRRLLGSLWPPSPSSRPAPRCSSWTLKRRRSGCET